MMSARHPGSGGFTLLEMLVALAIFGLLAVMSYGGLRSVLEQRSVTELEADRLGRLQKLYLIMQRDVEEVVPRPVRDEYGESLPPLVGQAALQFTRAGWSNPVGRPRSNLQRVGYAYEDGTLVRYTWLVLDRAQDTQPLRQQLNEEITGMDVRYMNDAGEWKLQWPDAQAGLQAGTSVDTLPIAVEVTLEHEHYGKLVWLFRTPRR